MSPDIREGDDRSGFEPTIPPVETTDEHANLVDNDANDPEEQSQVHIEVTPLRWYILLLFSLLGIYQGMVWNTFGPISVSLLAIFCPEWDTSTLALLGNWGNIMYIIPVIPVMWFFTNKGIRPSMILAGGLMFVGTMVRAFPLTVRGFTWMCHLCAILNGIAGIIVFSAPSALSSTWFPPHERTTATGIAIVFNNLGNAMSFFAAPAIVPDPKRNDSSTSGNLTYFGVDPDVYARPVMGGYYGDELYGNDSTVCPTIDPAEKAFIQERVSKLMYLEFGLIAACVIAILAYFPTRPKHPPSVSSSMERMEFLPGLKAICTNKNALLMTLCFSMFNGLIASWYSVMNITFEPLPIGNPEDKDRIIGYIGIWAIIGNSVATIMVSRIVDSLRGRMKLTILVLMVSAILCWIWLGLLCLRVIPFSLIQLYLSTILASAITYSTGPIFFEFTVELVYPVPEGIVGAFLTTVYNSVGMIFLFLFYVPQVASNPHWIPYAIMICTSCSLPLLLLVKEEYNRSSLDNQDESSTDPQA